MTSTQTEQARTIRLTNGTSFTIPSNTAKESHLIPTIDVRRIYSEDVGDRQAVAEEIRRAAHDIGFFLVVNHGVDDQLRLDVLNQAKSFFSLPLETKMEVCTDLIPSEFCGYHPMEHYNINGTKQRGKFQSSFILQLLIKARSPRSVQLAL